VLAISLGKSRFCLEHFVEIAYLLNRFGGIDGNIQIEQDPFLRVSKPKFRICSPLSLNYALGFAARS